MKKYLKYKNFIPIEFINKKEYQDRKSNRFGISLLILLNLLLIPINLDNIFYRNEINKDENMVSEPQYNYSDIYKWLPLGDLSLKNININNGIAEVIAKDSNVLKDIEEKGFVIQKIKVEGDNIVVTLKGDIIYEEE